MNFEALAECVFDSLGQIDREADSKKDGFPTGLCWYGPHAKPNLKRYQTEPAWSQRLACMLAQQGLSANAEVVYPGQHGRGKKKCDLVVTQDDGRCIWIEIKGAWKEWAIRTGSEWIYNSHLFHPLKAGLDRSKTHTAALDLKKLELLTKNDAFGIGLLIVGFDSVDLPMQTDFEDFENLSGLAADSQWRLFYRDWNDHWRDGHRIRSRLWIRRID